MKQPNFFILGAPRCGTTALFSYLSEHPNIFLPEKKELHYFANELKDLWKFPFRSLDEYLALFNNAPEDALAIGEAASLYLFSPSAPQRIFDFNPNARLIISLRNPLDFAYSYHQLNLSLRREDVEDFSKAWNLCEERKRGEHVPTNARAPLITMYQKLGFFGQQVEQVLSIFPKEQVRIILLDDIKNDMHKVYLELEEFLDVPDDGRSQFLPVNENFTYKSKLAQKILHPSLTIYQTYRKITSHLPTRLIDSTARLQEKLVRIFTKPETREPLDPQISDKVLSFYESDIKKLETLLERDLSHWRERKQKL